MDSQNDHNSLGKKVEFLKEKLLESIEYVRKKRHQNQRKASYIKIISIVFSGSATILLGLQISGYDPVFKQIAFVLGALVTLLTGLEPYYNFRGLWVEHERAEYLFHRLLDEIEFYLAGIGLEELNPKRIAQFNEIYQDIWRRVSEDSLEQRQVNRYNI